MSDETATTPHSLIINSPYNQPPSTGNKTRTAACLAVVPVLDPAKIKDAVLHHVATTAR